MEFRIDGGRRIMIHYAKDILFTDGKVLDWMNKIGRLPAAIAALFALVCGGSLSAAELVEPGSGDDAAAIAAAIAAAGSGDGVVRLAPGTYTLSSQVTIDRPVTVKGAGRLLTRIVSDGTTHRLFYLNNAEAVLSDITLADATANNGGAGVYINAGTLQDAVVRDCTNTSGYSGGVWVQNGAVRRCVLTGNQSNSGGGGGGVYAKGTAIIENTLAYGNAAAWGGGIYVESGCKAALVNCTFADNTAWKNGMDTYDYSGNGALCATNTIFGVLVKNNNAKNSIYTRCYSSTDANPLYVAAGGGNYRLSAASPLLGVGVAVECVRDLDGNPFAATPSAGAYQPAVAEVFEVPSSGLLVGSTMDVTVHFPAGTAGGEGTLFVVAPDGSSVSYDVSDGEPCTVRAGLIGGHSLVLRMEKDGAVVTFDLTNAFFAGLGEVYVDPLSATPAEPYATPETAARTIEAALTQVMGGGTVLICDCTYTVSSVIGLNRDITLKGLNGREKAIFLQGGENRLFSLDHPKARLSGLTLRGLGAATKNLTGLGVHLSAGGGSVVDCLFENFISANGSGAAAFAELGEGTFERCVFRNNRAATHAGGAYASAKGRLNLRNCLFYGNTSGSNWGSAVYVDGPGTMVNCTLYNNPVTPEIQGEFCRCHANFAVTNCILGSVSWYTGSSNRANNLGGSTSLTDPGFRDAANGDYRLVGSATTVIDQGEDAAVADGETDMAGARRIQGEHVDIGCYEFAAEEFSAGFTVDGTASAVGESVRLVPTVTGGQNPVNSWRAVNVASGTTIAGTTTGSGDDAAFEVTFAEPGVYSFFYSVRDGENTADSSILRSVTILATGDVYVAVSGTPVSPFDTPETAMTNLWAAAEIAPDGATVHVLAGVHRVGARVRVSRGVKVLGAGRDRTVVTSEPNAVHGLFAVSHRDSSLRELTMTATFGAAYADGNGGCARVTAGGLVADCLITNVVMNAAFDGTAIRASSGLEGPRSRISRVACLRCRGGKYGTIAAENAVVDNCLVADSSVGQSYGGGIYVDSTYVGSYVTNCTFVGTQVKYAYTYNAKTKFVNCVFDCPVSTQGDVLVTNVYIHCASSPTVKADEPHRILEGWLTELGNRNEVELGLVDAANGDYHLRRSSALRRAGVVTPGMESTLDLEGRPRVSSGSVDLGCYELGCRGMIIVVR